MRPAITLTALLVSVPLAAHATVSDTIARTASGPVEGRVRDGVKEWLGIPFAAPPVGANRWRAPQPAAGWTGVRPATAYGHDCMQKPFPSDAAPLGTEPAEDCLVLNVWAPRTAGPRTRLPVVVWIYGGGFVNGGSSPPTYAGASLARKGVVFVSFNYRVGRFGTFVHPALDRAAGGPQSGNFGLMDQLAALRWVKANIAAFGGDPGNVTIMGESAGGMSVNTLVTSPQSAGLFQRAVVMSGGDGTAMGASRAAAEQASIAFADGKGIARDDADGAARLRSLSALKVTADLNLGTLFSGATGPRTFASPYPDGQMAVAVAEAYRAGQFAHVPIMIGATSADIGGPDGYMLAGARELAKTLALSGVPTFYYRFSYVADSLERGAGAGHATDIPFFLDTQGIKYGVRTTSRDIAMGRSISSYILNFAKRGNPNGPELPAWPAFSPDGRMMMDFAADGDASVVQDKE
ncbi:carboxylesterase family protein [Sphingomonas sp. ZT3P38]|uniref:carboxylesterase/lipase family protein n=1 Tax=Parasphingomonas zepuensis TaxID=3096161 RepID=UPI002FC7BE1A